MELGEIVLSEGGSIRYGFRTPDRNTIDLLDLVGDLTLVT